MGNKCPRMSPDLVKRPGTVAIPNSYVGQHHPYITVAVVTDLYVGTRSTTDIAYPAIINSEVKS